MDRRHQRETLFTMLDEKLLAQVIENNFPKLINKIGKYKSLPEKIDFLANEFGDHEKFSGLLAIISKLHTNLGEIK